MAVPRASLSIPLSPARGTAPTTSLIHLGALKTLDGTALCGIPARAVAGSRVWPGSLCPRCVEHAVDQGWSALRQTEKSWLSLARLMARSVKN